MIPTYNTFDKFQLGIVQVTTMIYDLWNLKLSYLN
jgi:hypothetical protein